MIEALPGRCEEAALSMGPGVYMPCNMPATTLLDGDGRTYRMCDFCTLRNVFRGMVIVGSFVPAPARAVEVRP